MKKLFASIGTALRKATPLYLALLVICGILANAGFKLPSALQWAYEPVEQTTAYAAALAEDFEAAQAPQEAYPEALNVATGVFQNTYVAANGDTIDYVIRVPEGITPNMPLIVYLHEENVASIPALAATGAVQAADNVGNNACIIIQPLCAKTWTAEYQEALVRELTMHITNKFYCDASRVVLTGYDTGAAGVWYYAALHPEFWKSISPISAAPATDIRPILGHDIDCYMAYGEFEVYAIKGEMKRVGTQLVESGATVIRVDVDGAYHDTMRVNAYDDVWFDWACN